MTRSRRVSMALVLSGALLIGALRNLSLAITTERFVSEKSSPGDFCIVERGNSATLYVDTNDYPGVIRVGKDLQTDVERVSDIKLPTDSDNEARANRSVIILGTLGRSRLIDRLVSEHRIDVTPIAGKWEASLIEVVQKPWPGIDKALIVAGSDKRATIYGVYELCEQIGVSPWYWWADVPPKKHPSLYVKKGRYTIPPPAVKYRGIFINDEGPCLMTWARKKYGELNHQMYTNMFELILRLRGNYLWPAMWDNSFATDDPLNAKLADEYGVVIATSHHEPMMRAWKEWERSGHRKGSWDYSKNSEILRNYWQEGIRRTKDYEKVITIGMRGDGDEPMSETDSIALLERIVADQRRIIGDEMQTKADKVPQVWALYKEVQGYYDKGMRVPEDVTLLWCDDNWGNVRRLPTATERLRPGGAGIYYHFDYVGGPRNYKWVNTIPIIKAWEQMNLAYQYGADRLWIVNVGDLKPLEFPMEFFLTFARDPSKWPKERVAEFGRLWAEREFGAEHAREIADIVSKYTKYNGRRKPELLEPGTFSIENYGEADRVLEEWRGITERAERIYETLPLEAHDAFFELVLYPTKACAVLNELYISVAKNRYYAERGDSRANEFARRARELFEEDARLASDYNHKLANGKWNHMMDQTHIGYTGWQQPQANVMPKLKEVPTSDIPPSERRAENSEKTQSSGLPTPAPAMADLPKDWKGFVEADGYVSMEAEHFTGKKDTAGAHWEVVPDLGRTGASMSIFPVTASFETPPQKAPGLEYRMWLSSTGAVDVTLLPGPCLNFAPERGVRIGVGFDNEVPRILTIVPKGYVAGDGNRDWEESVKDGVRKVKFQQMVERAGDRTIYIWAVDPGITLQKIVVDTGGVKPSYLGPPESWHR